MSAPGIIERDLEADRWARVAVLARLVEIEQADLDSEEDVWRVLMRKGVGAGEAFQLSQEIIMRAKSNRACGEMATLLT